MKNTKLKKLSLALILSLSINEALADDSTSACGALLCLAGGVTSGECASYVAKYFNIFDPNPAKMITKRMNFLKLCPTNQPPPANLPNDVSNAMNTQANDPEFDRYMNEIVPNMSEDCSKENLNRVEEKSTLINGSYVKFYRINPNPTNSCNLLLSSKYSNKKITYTCASKDFYTETDWFNGYTKTYLSYNEYMVIDEDKRGSEKKDVLISSSEYNKLPNDMRKMLSEYKNGREIKKYYRIDTLYFKKNFIDKDCWEVEDKITG